MRPQHESQRRVSRDLRSDHPRARGHRAPRGPHFRSAWWSRSPPIRTRRRCSTSRSASSWRAACSRTCRNVEVMGYSGLTVEFARAARSGGDRARPARGVGLRVRIPARQHGPAPAARHRDRVHGAEGTVHLHLLDAGARDRNARRRRQRVRASAGGGGVQAAGCSADERSRAARTCASASHCCAPTAAGSPLRRRRLRRLPALRRRRPARGHRQRASAGHGRGTRDPARGRQRFRRRDRGQRGAGGRRAHGLGTDGRRLLPAASARAMASRRASMRASSRRRRPAATCSSMQSGKPVPRLRRTARWPRASRASRPAWRCSRQTTGAAARAQPRAGDPPGTRGLSARRAPARSAARRLAQFARRARGGARFPAPTARCRPVGTLIRQPELAATLESWRSTGSTAFYQGTFAAQLVAGVRAQGGIWTEADLAALPRHRARADRRPVTAARASFRRRRRAPAASRSSRR